MYKNGNILFIWGFSAHLKTFHFYGDVTMTGEGLQILAYLALMAIEQLGFVGVPNLV